MATFGYSTEPMENVMPVPANWLEELVIEWLDLEGFVTSTNISVPAKPGGKFAPDAVGAKRGEKGNLVIRHCEAAMFLIDAPDTVAERYARKFSETESEVRSHFENVFGVGQSDRDVYEKWVITFQASENVQKALREVEPGVKIYFLKDFIRNEVLETIRKWKSRQPHPKTAGLPTDKCLLDVINRFEHFGLLTKEMTE